MRFRMSRRRVAGSASAVAFALAVIGLSACGGDPVVTSAPATTTTTPGSATTSATTVAPTGASTIPPISIPSGVPASPTTPPLQVSATTTPSGASTTTKSPTTTGSSTTSTTVAAHAIEFHSPTDNIHCEIDYGAPFPTNVAMCFTDSPEQSATLSSKGTYSTCTGAQCLANPGEGEVNLPYGQKTGKGPFVCTSADTGMTCTVNGKGFEISRSGIATVG